MERQGQRRRRGQDHYKDKEKPWESLRRKETSQKGFCAQNALEEAEWKEGYQLGLRN